MTETLLLALWFFMAHAQQIAGACLVGSAVTLFGLGMGAVGFTFFVFKDII